MNESSLVEGKMAEELSNEECYYEPPPLTTARFWLVTVFGSGISFISILENLMLFFLFATKKAHRNNHNMYLMLLAFFDFFVSLAYIVLMSVNVLSDYLQSPALVGMWFSYMVPIITISHIAMTSATFLIIAASFERYCLTTSSRALLFAQRNRPKIAMFAVILGITSKGSICIEFEVSRHLNCTGQMSEWQMRYRPFVFGTLYHTIWRFWYRNFVTIFAPFFILSFLNARIVGTLSKTSTNSSVFAHFAGNLAMEQARRKATARAATRTMVAVTCCYLISNIVNVIVTIWEHVDKQTLFQDYIKFYAIAVDMVSLLTTLACACRLPIYLYCQTELRAEIVTIVNMSWNRWIRKFNPILSFKDEDRVHTNSSGVCRSVTTNANFEKKRISLTLLLPDAPHPEIQLKKGVGKTREKPVAIISAYQHFPRRSFDTLTRDSSAAIKFLEKNGEYDEDIHCILESGKETLL